MSTQQDPDQCLRQRHALRHESIGLGGRVSVCRAVRKVLQESEAQAEMVGGGDVGGVISGTNQRRGDGVMFNAQVRGVPWQYTSLS